MITIGPIPQNQIEEVVQVLLKAGQNSRVFTFTGDLGAGKTTLIRQFVKALGAKEEVNSPTFGIINEYTASSGRTICHTDWYRIKDISELLDAGITEYLYDDNCLLLVEWPEIGMPLLLAEKPVSVSIEHAEEQRIYRIASDFL
jgi:tRNA threonylcarbamoyladenosine biosynthesis protein TsaE